MIGLVGESEGDNPYSLQLSYPVPVNRLTPDNKMKALTARRLSLAMPGRDGGTKPEFVSHPELSDN